MYVVKYKSIHSNILFTPFGSDCANEVFNKFNMEGDRDTVYYLRNNILLVRSRAVGALLVDMGRWNRVLGFLVNTFPKKPADWFYNFIAANRYWFFGKKKICDISDKQKEFIVCPTARCSFQRIEPLPQGRQV
jgi:predicted DCC family thiol-disulfide oxidoreductase YuxK